MPEDMIEQGPFRLVANRGVRTTDQDDLRELVRESSNSWVEIALRKACESLQ